MARQGKIARLPAVLRAEVNQRLLDGQGAPQILPWLNSQADAIRIWEELFEGVPCSPQNLSEWKLGGYKEWRAKQDRVQDLKELSSYALGLVKAANGTIADAAAAIAAGHIVEVMENVGNIVVTGGTDDAEADPNKGLSLIVGGIAKLQKGDRDREASRRKDETLALQKERHKLSKKQVALAEQKFRHQTVQAVMDSARRPEILAVLASRDSKEVQFDKIHQLMFGERPKGGSE